MSRYSTRARQFAAISSGMEAMHWTPLREDGPTWHQPELNFHMTIEQVGGDLVLRMVPVDSRARYGVSIGQVNYVLMATDDLPGAVLRIVPAMVRKLCAAITDHLDAASSTT